MRHATLTLLGFVLSIMLTPSASAGAVATDLRCEGSSDPTGVDVAAPPMSWVVTSEEPGRRGVRQAAYRILVASSPAHLANDVGDLWDSGRVASARTSQIAYAGRALASGQQCFWKVRLWEGAETPGPWSRPTSWTVGLLHGDDWRPAKWIGLADDGAATKGTAGPGSLLLRRAFIARPDLRRAALFVTGLAHYEASINGTKVGDQLLAPGWTDYRKTVLYDTFEVTDAVRAGGENAIGLTLGNGMYHIEPTAGRYVKFTNSFGPLKAIAQLRLEYADGSVETVGTDAGWQARRGPITYSNVFGGEDHDARRHPKGWDERGLTPDGEWRAAAELDGPGGALRGHSVAAPAIRAIEARRPIAARDVDATVTVYDLGQNASFMPRLVVRGPSGSRVRVVPSELLGTDGRVDRASCVQDAGGPAWWQHTLDGSGAEAYFPKFFYQGARYFQVERLAAEAGGALPVVESIEGVVVHSSAEPVGTFACSNELLNKTYALVRWAQRSNMMSLMTDCPQREKLGWLEQLHLNGPSLRYNFRLDRLYAKAMNDMADAQLDVGLVPNIAPEYFLAHTDKLTDGFRNSPEWGSSFVIAPHQQLAFTGDDALQRDHYPRMVRYVDFLATLAKDDVIEQGLGDWYDLGPKPPWGSQLTPPPFTATAIYYWDLTILRDVALRLGKPEESDAFAARAARVREAFNKRFYDAGKRRYATGSQCTSAIPLVLGLCEPANRDAVLQALIDDIRGRGDALTAGDVGYRFVLRALADAGRSDVVFAMNSQTDRPGYGMQIARGATALTEKWDASVGNFGSQNHFMLGQINEWFFHDLAGIRLDLSDPAAERIEIRPSIVGDVTHVRATYDSVRGRIASEWRDAPAGLTLRVTVPHNAAATVYVPTRDPDAVREGGRPAAESAGVRFLRGGPGFAVYAVESGDYEFAAPR